MGHHCLHLDLVQHSNAASTVLPHDSPSEALSCGKTVRKLACIAERALTLRVMAQASTLHAQRVHDVCINVERTGLCHDLSGKGRGAV